MLIVHLLDLLWQSSEVPSDAAETLTTRMVDVDRLLEIHSDIGGAGRGRRIGVEVLNRSAVVLTTAVWEGYVEELAAASVEHLVECVAGPEALPDDLKKIGKEIKKDAHELAPWKLAGAGWKDYLRERLANYAQQDANGLNTPKHAQVDALFQRAIALPEVSAAWSWSNMKPKRARDKLDEMVTLRGDIAHGSGAARNVLRDDVITYRDHEDYS